MFRNTGLFGLMSLCLTVSCGSSSENNSPVEAGGSSSGGTSSTAAGAQGNQQNTGGATQPGAGGTTTNTGGSMQPGGGGTTTMAMGGATGGGGTMGMPNGGSGGNDATGGTQAMMGGQSGMSGGAGGGISDGGAGGGGDTGGPPDGAYVACSGDDPPALKLTTVIEDLDLPIYATTPDSDPQTMFVVMRGGELRRYDLSQTPPTFASLVQVNSSTANECGFFSVAPHPNYDGDGEKRIYLSYTPTCPASIFGAGGSSTLDEYIVDGDTATFSQTLLQIDQPQGNHNGGLTKFGPDGYLYLGLGDGGGGNDNSTGHASNGNGQDVSVPFGKLLRFDVDNPGTAPTGNLTAADVGGGNVDQDVYHRGLRNPWRWSFDRLTGDLYIGDVGQDTCEEVNFLAAGTGPSNFGWSAREGTIACSACGGHSVFPDGTQAVEPLFAYPTDKTQPFANGGCDHPLAIAGATNGAVIGGYVYRGNKIPGLYGRYIFTDFERKNGNRAPIFSLTVDDQGNMCDLVEDLIPNGDLPAESVASFAEDADGELYIVNMTRGEISRIDPQ